LITKSRDVPIGIKARARHTSFGDVDAQLRRQCLHVGVFTAEASLFKMSRRVQLTQGDFT
jgi:hypothetical protein